jgi:phage shock protein PspC (stress-responsive transcriptional regulator)
MNENFASKRFTRSDSNRFLTGVCGGIAAYTGIDATIVRLIFVVFGFLGGGVFVYILAWLLMPAESEQRSLLEQIIRNFQGKASQS